MSDIKVPPFTDGQKEVIEATKRIANGKLICDVDDDIDVLTNEEYIRTCSTAELVHVIHLMTSSCYVCGSDGVDYGRCYFRKKCTGPKEIEEWLKEIHHE